MANTKTIYVASDDSGIYMFEGRPVLEDGIWIETNHEHSHYIMQLTLDEVKALGLELRKGDVLDVSLTATLIEHQDLA